MRKDLNALGHGATRDRYDAAQAAKPSNRQAMTPQYYTME
jgi:hypothetical protein